MSPALQTVEEMRELLKAVSRSFYLSIVFLPVPMRHSVSLGYMLARATDSVADTSTAAPQRRAQVLESMGRAVAGTLPEGEEKELLHVLATSMADAQEKPSERLLLQRFGDCLAALRGTPEAEATLIRKVLATIVEGQLWDLRFFEDKASVGSDEETRRYTCLVAGCVGEFWTELGYATMGVHYADPAPEYRELMNRAGVRYGCGLQLVNILRDRCEDAARGRSYLADTSEPALAKWLGRAERYLNDGLDYAARLRCFRLRFATMLPALIGLRTLALIRRTPGAPKVKIPRRAVYLCMLHAAMAAMFPNKRTFVEIKNEELRMKN